MSDDDDSAATDAREDAISAAEWDYNRVEESGIPEENLRIRVRNAVQSIRDNSGALTTELLQIRRDQVLKAAVALDDALEHNTGRPEPERTENRQRLTPAVEKLEEAARATYTVVPDETEAAFEAALKTIREVTAAP